RAGLAGAARLAAPTAGGPPRQARRAEPGPGAARLAAPTHPTPAPNRLSPPSSPEGRARQGKSGDPLSAAAAPTPGYFAALARNFLQAGALNILPAECATPGASTSCQPNTQPFLRASSRAWRNASLPRS